MESDTQLQQEVITSLQCEQSVNAARIGVQVERGVVVLSGHVNSEDEKLAAERAAQSVAGVRALTVELIVTLSSINQRNDADIASSADNALQWSIAVPRDSVQVMVEDGWVTLSGAVELTCQRQAAEAAVRVLMGVTGVSNEIIAAQTTRLRDADAANDFAARQATQMPEHGVEVGVLGGLA